MWLMRNALKKKKKTCAKNNPIEVYLIANNMISTQQCYSPAPF